MTGKISGVVLVAILLLGSCAKEAGSGASYAPAKTRSDAAAELKAAGFTATDERSISWVFTRFVRERPKLVGRFLDAGLDPHVKSSDGLPLITAVAREGQTDLVRRL